MTGDSSMYFKQLRTTILRNRAGVFVETDTTALHAPGVFENTRLDHDVQAIDVNQGGLPDLVLVRTQAGYSGWFVQILINERAEYEAGEQCDRVVTHPVNATRPRKRTHSSSGKSPLRYSD